jgi:group II intron reverse transcriptase/maturase
MQGTSSPANVTTKLERIAKLARDAPKMVLTTLAHQIDEEFLLEAYRRTRKDGATGVDEQTADEYASNLQGNLCSLLGRLKSGTYRAPPVRRVHSPKGDGKPRPIGIPTFEDQVLQRAVARVLEAVYEQDFPDCSYGFRPGRSAHQLLDALWRELDRRDGGWVLEVDIQGFFDSLDHHHLRGMLDQRVRDGVIRRAIDKWLKAGVFEHGRLRFSELGTPQGGVVSPVLANVYLHEALDVWFEREVKPRLRGAARLFRYADDLLIVFELETDARKVLDVLPKRFGKYGLTLHPEKTRLIAFHRPTSPDGTRQDRRPDTFDLLGFTHFWGKSYRGGPVLKRKTARGRLWRAVKAIAAWCRSNRHRSVAEQHKALNRKLNGHYGYYGITGNSRELVRFQHITRNVWRKWLDRRSQRAKMTWERFTRLLERYPLAPARVVHSIYARAANPSA